MDKYSPITIARFWSKVDVKKSNSECWPWTGATRFHGYGGIKVKGDVLRAHRVAWELFNQAEIGDLHALHKCDNPKCCNPRHIYLGTRSDNMKDIRDRERNPNQKMTMAMANEIREALKRGDKPRWLAEEYGLATGTISKIKTGRIWTP